MCRCPKNRKVVCDQSYEFKLEFKKPCETHDDMSVPSSRRNPQNNEIVERTHIMLLSVLRALKVSDATWEDEERI